MYNPLYTPCPGSIRFSFIDSISFIVVFILIFCFCTSFIACVLPNAYHGVFSSILLFSSFSLLFIRYSCTSWLRFSNGIIFPFSSYGYIHFAHFPVDDFITSIVFSTNGKSFCIKILSDNVAKPFFTLVFRLFELYCKTSALPFLFVSKYILPSMNNLL